jgi:hypothetical protein
METLVNNENKCEYVRLSIEQHTRVFVREGLDVVLGEIYSVVPKQLW